MSYFDPNPEEKLRQNISLLVGKKWTKALLPWTKTIKAQIRTVAEKHNIEREYFCHLLFSVASDWPSLPSDQRRGLNWSLKLAFWNGEFKDCDNWTPPLDRERDQIDDAVREMATWVSTVVKKAWLRLLFQSAEAAIPMVEKYLGKGVEDHITMLAYVLSEFRKGLDENEGIFDFAPQVNLILNGWLASK